jgi:enamine deaminase RidA (YjgF/YER057c/UK114 family)
MNASPPQILQPPEWPRPSGYSNGVAVEGRLVFISGQIGWDAAGKFVATSMAAQVRQALENIVTILAEARGKPEHIVRLTWYVTSRDEYSSDLKAIGESYRAVMGKHFPTMSVVQVVALMEREAKVEIEATAVIPPAG